MQEDISTILSSSSLHPASYADYSSANMKQVVSLEMEAIQRSHESLPSTSSTALFHSNYITGEHSMCMSPPIIQQSPIQRSHKVEKAKDFVGFVI